VDERHRHRYEVNPNMVDEFQTAGMHFVGTDEGNLRMEIAELKGHPFYVAVQYHPEYLSRPMRPSAPFLGLILAAVGKLSAFLAKDSQELQCVGPARHHSGQGDNSDDEEIASMIRNVKIGQRFKHNPRKELTSSGAPGAASSSTNSSSRSSTASPEHQELDVKK